MSKSTKKLEILLSNLLTNSTEEVYEFNNEIIIFKTSKPIECMKLRPEDDKVIIAEKHFLQEEISFVKHLGSIESTSTPTKTEGSQKSEPEFDVTGSPLQCAFEVEETNEVFLNNNIEKYSLNRSSFQVTINGFSLSFARQLASHVRFAMRSMSKSGDVECPLPVWIACNSAENISGIVFLGCGVTNCESVCSFVKMEGPFNTIESLPSIDAVMSEFSIGCTTNKIFARAEANYAVLKEEGSNYCFIDVCSAFNNPLSIFSLPALSADTSVTVNINTFDIRCPARSLFEELQTLERFIQGFNKREMEWTAKENQTSVFDLLSEMFSNFVNVSGKRNTNRCNKNIEDIDEGKLFEMPASSDFTDNVWSVLMNCTSLQEMNDSFHSIFSALSTGLIRPHIHMHNKTKFAVLARSLVRSQSDVPVIKGSKCLEMLIEIGLEKIKKDYTKVFEINEFSTDEQLLPFIQWQSTKEMFVENYTNLKKLHIALEVILLLKLCLELPVTLITQFSKQILQQQIQAEPQKYFVFSIQMPYIINVLKQLHPTSWKLCMSYSDESNHVRKHGAFHIMHTVPIAQTKGIQEQNTPLDTSEDANIEDKDKFYTTFSTIITDSLVF